MFENELNGFFRKHVTLLRVLLALFDVVLLNAAFHLALFVRFQRVVPRSYVLLGAPWSIYPNLELFMTLTWVAIAALIGLYEVRSNKPSHEEAGDVIKGVGVLAGTFFLYIVARGGYNYYSRLFLLYFFILAPVLLIGFRMLLHGAMARAREQATNRKNVLIIGAGRAAERFYRTLLNNPQYGYNVIGFLDDDAKGSNLSTMILGGLSSLGPIAVRQRIDEAVIAFPKVSEDALSDLVAVCDDRCIRVSVIPNDYAALEGKRTVEQVGEFSLVRTRTAPLDLPLPRFVKRAFDVAFSALVLVTVFPIVFLFSAILIKLTSRGPIFFRQERTGEDGRSFVCFKFRTMRQTSREVSDSLQALPNDPRLTAIGKLLRRTDLDELPQFWNVLKGDMSVVGPRPHMLKHTEDYRNTISQYMVRHFVKPGVTGWAQVNGFRGATELPEKMQRRIEYDLYYVENWGFLFDVAIIGRTVIAMLRGNKHS